MLVLLKKLSRQTLLRRVVFLSNIFFVLFIPTNLWAATTSPSSLSTSSAPTNVTQSSHPIWQGFDIIGRASGLPTADLSSAVGGLVRVALSFLGLLLFINIFYAGVLWMFSGGNEEKTGTAKKIILSSIIGLIIIIFSYSITAFIIRTFLGATEIPPP